ncbi:hypothetical protein [Pseudoxanthomonas wuyuanensis]|uniref:Uncharacterized protein n=1 Tax=Pseudoxanthomonas wuyuanensis TaxID=1073196 RepID=A0A286DBK4_9GAMM|nr:hypothetical protein [Pseudoxanthomonas wuyuanensis]SOD56036.1 hypothetical protein SAMN06296416_108143 [Pseudoxanthomonas wuyuanensis]
MRHLLLAGLVAVALMGASVSAHSAEHLVGQVTRVYVTSAGTVNFRLSGGCKTSTYFYFSLASDASKAWYAMLLSAATTKQPVRISIADPCDATINQPIQYIFQDF